MFRIDRQQFSTGFSHGIHKELAGHDQGFFIGQQHALASAHRRQCRRQPGSPDNRSHYGVGLFGCCYVDKPWLAAKHVNVRAIGEQASQFLCRPGIRHHRYPGAEFAAKRG